MASQDRGPAAARRSPPDVITVRRNIPGDPQAAKPTAW